MTKTKQTNTMPNSKLDTIIAELNKDLGDGTINRYKNAPSLEYDYISTGVPFLDWCITGVGKGIPQGRMVEFYGIPSGGKSLISQLIVAQAQKAGGECVWIDAENAFDPVFARLLGVDVDKLVISQLSIGESVMDMMRRLLAAKPAVIVVDSVASLVPEVELEKTLSDALMAPKARLMSRGLPLLNAENHHTIMIFINQLRSSMNMYGPATVTTGGRALTHYASLRIEVQRGDFLEEGKAKIGQVVKFRVTKNKCGPPFKEGFFNFYYDGRIDLAGQLVALGILTNKIKQAGPWYECGEFRFMGKEAFIEAVSQDKAFQEKLLKELA